jgi:hypothetical protein
LTRILTPVPAYQAKDVGGGFFETFSLRTVPFFRIAILRVFHLRVEFAFDKGGRSSDS